MRKERAVLFDFDGTLIDTEPAILYSYGKLFETYRSKEEFIPEYQVAVLGPSIDSMIALYFPNEDTQKLVDEYRHIQKEHMEELTTLMPHALELLKWLKEEGYPTSLVSSRRRDSIDNVLNFLHLNAYFEFNVGYDEVKEEKPHPEGILKAMEYYGCEKGIYIGDSPNDILAGQNANIPTVGYVSKEEKRYAIAQCEPTYLITDLMEVKEILEGLD